MNCADVLALVEGIACGDVSPNAAVREHLESCPRCAAELASARRIEGWLRSRPAETAPPRFTPAVMQRIRRERWRAEQNVDRLFNAAMAVALVLVVGGVAALLNVGALLGAAAQVWGAVAGLGAGLAQSAAPSLNLYLGAAALLASAVAMWWWADRTWSL